jgi:antigen flippase
LDRDAKRSYNQIFRSTGIIFSSSVFTTAAGIVKTKVLASLLGPAGIGLFGIYNSVLGTAGALTGCGLSMSGVRQIAAADSCGDQKKVAATWASLQWATLILSILGTALFFLLRERIAFWTFGDNGHANDLAILSLGIIPLVVGGAQGSILYGLRKIGDIARRNIFSAAAVTVLSITVVYLFRDRGIVYIVALSSAASLAFGYHYLGKLRVDRSKVSIREIRSEIPALFRLGIVFMSTGFMVFGTQSLVRIIVNRQLGLESIGHFQAAWTISAIYVGFVLDAMLKDYYPRLTALAADDEGMSRLVNHQTEIALLITGPLIIGMLTFSPIVINLLYSSKFDAAYPILRWLAAGTLFQVAAWPLGFVIVAKGYGKTYFCTELLWNLAFIAGVLLGVGPLALASTGVSYLAAWILYGIVVYCIARVTIRFRYSRKNIFLLSVLSLALFLVLALSHLHPGLGFLLGGVLTFAALVFSVRSVLAIVGTDEPLPFRQALQKLVAMLGKLFPKRPPGR